MYSIFLEEDIILIVSGVHDGLYFNVEKFLVDYEDIHPRLRLRRVSNLMRNWYKWSRGIKRCANRLCRMSKEARSIPPNSGFRRPARLRYREALLAEDRRL